MTSKRRGGLLRRLQHAQGVRRFLRPGIVEPTDHSLDQLGVLSGHSHIEWHGLPRLEVDREPIQPGDEGQLLALDGGRGVDRHRPGDRRAFIGQHEATMPHPGVGDAQSHPGALPRLDLLAVSLLLDRRESSRRAQKRRALERSRRPGGRLGELRLR